MDKECKPVPDSAYDDDPPPTSLLEEYPDIVGVLLEPVDVELPSSGLFDEFADELETPVDSYVQDTASAEAGYARIFQEMEEGELSGGEIEQEIEEIQALEVGDLDDNTSGLSGGGMLEAGESFPETGLSDTGLPDSVMPAGGIVAGGAAILAGGILAAKVSSKHKDEKQELAWYYSVDGQQAGPLAEGKLREIILLGQLPAHGYVWREGMSQWIAISDSDIFMHRCLSCGQPFAPGSLFCGDCGAKLSGSESRPTATDLPCPRCRAKLKPKARFCGKCGQKI